MGCNCGGAKRANAVTNYEVWKDGKKVFESVSKHEADRERALAGAGATIKPVPGK